MNPMWYHDHGRRGRHGRAGGWLGFLAILLVALGATPTAYAVDLTGGAVRTAPIGAPVTFQLPTAGPLPRTYRVTLAIVERHHLNWIISQFVCGKVETVTSANGGHFIAYWNGLDDNYMPVPPGTYAVKGIYMPASRWAVDGRYHTITPQFVGGASAWLPPRQDFHQTPPLRGDPVESPLGAIACSPGGVAVIQYVYLENGLNDLMVNLNKKPGHDQVLRSFESGGVAGGTAVTTDGNYVWSANYLWNPADQRPQTVVRFGGPHGVGADAHWRYVPEGQVTGMACQSSPTAGRSLVYVAQGGRWLRPGLPHQPWRVSNQRFIDTLTVLDGATAQVLAQRHLRHPRGLAIYKDWLYAAVARRAGGFGIRRVKLVRGLPQGAWRTLFQLPGTMNPVALAVDSHGRIYVCDESANQVYQFNAAGRMLHRFGRLEAQKPGTYDPGTFISPGSIATWRDPQGHDRLLVMDRGGPNSVTEWTAQGSFVHQYLSLQTMAEGGYVMDSRHPREFYTCGQRNTLVRLHFNYTTGKFRVDAVWPLAFIKSAWKNGDNRPDQAHLETPTLTRVDGHTYLASGREYVVYRRDGDQWRLSAAIIKHWNHGHPKYFLWHDANGNGRVDSDELTPLNPPPGVFPYFGDKWLNDLSLVAIGDGTRSVWRLAPVGFDAHGNPIYRQFTKLLTDTVYQARGRGKASAIYGGNELADRFTSAWAGVNGSMTKGFYVQARGGRNFNANIGSETKISRYVPNGRGGFSLRWRTGRQVLGPLAQPGQIYGSINLSRPINGILPVIDQSRCGVVLYTTDGLYVDTLFPDSRKFSAERVGVYSLPGEFFVGRVDADKKTGKIYCLMGKCTPMIFGLSGWSVTHNPVHTLVRLQQEVTITAAQIVHPSPMALNVRGGAGVAKAARFSPAVGGAVLNGSMRGWQACNPVVFAADKHRRVKVRLLYDASAIYLRWHVRLGQRFKAQPLDPINYSFMSGRHADTLSFYIQTDPHALPPQGTHATDGRPGDGRFVFGIFKSGRHLVPVALGMYKTWPGPDGHPQSYASPANGAVKFAHVAPVAGAQVHYRLDPDGRGFILTASLPRSAIPGLPALNRHLHTLVDFSANLGGHDKFWWANSDGSANTQTHDAPAEARLYPGAWAPAIFAGLKRGLVIRDWLECGPFGGAGVEKLSINGNGNLQRLAKALFSRAVYPPDTSTHYKATYSGPLIQGWWPHLREIHWRPVRVSHLDTRAVLGAANQVWYAATWIHAPRAVQVRCAFRAGPMAYYRFTLNGRPLALKPFTPVPKQGHVHVSQSLYTLDLKKGWNIIRVRAYAIGYYRLWAGLVLTGPRKYLWDLQLSGWPPHVGH